MKTLLVAGAIALLFPYPAYAYVDPGFGSLVIQAIVATFIGGLFYIRQVREKIISFFRRGDKADEAEDKTTPTEKDD